MPLSEKTILITRAASQSSQFGDLLQAQGANVIEMPTLEIVPPSSWQDLDRAIAHIDQFDWLILTSTNGVDAFFQRLEAVTGEQAFYSNIKIAVVGEKTAQRLATLGLQPDFMPPDFIADSLVAHFPEPVAGLRILFPRVESGGREVLVKELTSQGAKVREVAAYESRCPATIAPAALQALQAGRVDVVTCASAKTVQHFCQLLQPIAADWQRWLQGVAIAAIGPQTSKACQAQLGRVDVEAQAYTLEGLTQAIVAWVTTPEKPVSATETAAADIAPIAKDISPIAISPTSEASATENVPTPEPAPATETAPIAENFPAATTIPTAEFSLETDPIAVGQSAPIEINSAVEPSPLPLLPVNDQLTAIGQPPTPETLLIEVELVADSEDVPPLETVQVELDSPVSNASQRELFAAETAFLAEIQAVIEPGEPEQLDP